MSGAVNLSIKNKMIKKNKKNKWQIVAKTGKIRLQFRFH